MLLFPPFLYPPAYTFLSPFSFYSHFSLLPHSLLPSFLSLHLLTSSSLPPHAFSFFHTPFHRNMPHIRVFFSLSLSHPETSVLVHMISNNYDLTFAVCLYSCSTKKSVHLFYSCFLFSISLFISLLDNIVVFFFVIYDTHDSMYLHLN